MYGVNCFLLVGMLNCPLDTRHTRLCSLQWATGDRQEVSRAFACKPLQCLFEYNVTTAKNIVSSNGQRYLRVTSRHTMGDADKNKLLVGIQLLETTASTVAHQGYVPQPANWHIYMQLSHVCIPSACTYILPGSR